VYQGLHLLDPPQNLLCELDRGDCALTEQLGGLNDRQTGEVSGHVNQAGIATRGS
jgi:hypothetical protein